MNKIIARLAGVDFYWDDVNEVLTFIGAMAVDGDGSPRCYSAESSEAGLDSWASACYPDSPEDYKNILVCNSFGQPVVQTGLSVGEPAKGFFISTTSFQNRAYGTFDVRRYVDAAVIPYAVINERVRGMVKPPFIACKVEVDVIKGPMSGRTFMAVCADAGPSVGEGSIALAHLCGFPKATPRNGIDEACFRYRFYPGTEAVVSGMRYTFDGRVIEE